MMDAANMDGRSDQGAFDNSRESPADNNARRVLNIPRSKSFQFE
jgi:hypothetical protein